MAQMGSRGWARFRKNRGGIAGAVIVLFAVMMSVLAPVLSPHDPDMPYKARTLTTRGVPIGPDREFPLGADTLGRCELSRMLYGGRVSLSVAFAATALLSTVGTFVGVCAGYLGGKIDTILMRMVDVLLSLPFLLVVMAINKAVARPGIWVLFLVLGLLSWTGMSRQVRAKVMQVKEFEFVAAARALGATSVRIVGRHILPNVMGIIVVIATTLIAEMIVAESVLSYLGVGVVPPTASWGTMLREGESLIRTAPRLTIIPALAIFTTVVGFNLLGEGLRDAFDPRS
jgi:peptide/nickel transport system permease protein